MRAETIGRAYDGAVNRGVRIEAKAVGLLQVIAIGFALIALVADRHVWWLQVVSAVSILYLCFATIGALCLLRTAPRATVVSIHARQATRGLLQTALAAASLERDGPRASNYLDGMLQDLAVGFGAAILALLLTVLGVGHSGDGTGPVRSRTSNTTLVSTTTTAMVAPGTSPTTFVPRGGRP
jgi:hypothetical protein